MGPAGSREEPGEGHHDHETARARREGSSALLLSDLRQSRQTRAAAAAGGGCDCDCVANATEEVAVDRADEAAASEVWAISRNDGQSRWDRKAGCEMSGDAADHEAGRETVSGIGFGVAAGDRVAASSCGLVPGAWDDLV